MSVTVRYFAGAKAAAGTGEEHRDGRTLRAVLDAAVAARGGTDGGGAELARVVALSSFLVDGTAVADLDDPVRAGQTVDVLPPFAGG